MDKLEIIFGLLLMMNVGAMLYCEWRWVRHDRRLDEVWLRLSAVHDELNYKDRALWGAIAALQSEIVVLKGTDHMLLGKANMAVDLGHRANMEVIKMYKRPKTPFSTHGEKKEDSPNKLLQKVKKQLKEF